MGDYVKSWAPGCLVQDDDDVAYQPTDKEGKQIAASLTMYLRVLMWRVKMDRTPQAGQNHQCVIRPIAPLD
jgi:hypothetical protein